MPDTVEPTKIKFNANILVHSIPKQVSPIKSGPFTISDLNAEIAKMDKGIEFIPHVGEKDHLLDAFIAEKSSGDSSSSENQG